MARLVYVDRDGRERSVSVGAHFPRVTVGRNPDCVIQTTKPSVSRTHSEFVFNGAEYEVADLGSSNGTFINGREIRRQLLRDRDEVKCGDFVIRFFLEDNEQEQPQAYEPPGNAPKYEPTPTAMGDGLYGMRREVESRPYQAQEAGFNPRQTYQPAAKPVVPASSPGYNGYQSQSQSNTPAYSGNQPQYAQGYQSRQPMRAGYSQPSQPYQSAAQNAAATPQPRGYGQASGAFTPGAPVSGSRQPAIQVESQDNRQVEELKARIADQEAMINVLKDEAQAAAQKQVDTIQAQVAELTQELNTKNSELIEANQRANNAQNRVSDLEREVNQKQITVDSYQERYDKLKETAEGQMGQLDDYRTEIQRKREVIEELEHKLLQAKESKDKDADHFASLNDENADLKVRINQLERQVDEGQRASNLLEFELKKAQQETDNLRSMIDTEGSQNAGLQDELNNLRQVIEAKESELINKEQRLEEAEAELNQLSEHLESEQNERGRLHAELVNEGKHVKELQETVRELKNELQRVGDDNPDLRELADLRKETKALRERVAEFESDAGEGDQEMRDRITELRRENRSLRHNVEDLEEELTRAKRASSTASNEEVEALKQRILELESASEGGEEDQSRELRRLERDRSRLLDEVEDLKSELENAKKGGGDSRELRRLERDRTRLLEENEELQAELERARAGGSDPREVRRLERDRTRLIDEVEDLKAELERAKNSDSSSDTRRLERDRSRLLDEVEDLKSELEEAKAAQKAAPDTRRLERDRRRLLDEVEDLREQLEVAQQQRRNSSTTDPTGAKSPSAIRSMGGNPAVTIRQSSSPIARSLSAAASFVGKCRCASFDMACRTTSSSVPPWVRSPPSICAVGNPRWVEAIIAANASNRSP